MSLLAINKRCVYNKPKEFVYTEELTLSNYANRPGSRPPQRRKKKQSPAALILIVGIIVVAIVLIIIFATRGGGDSTAPTPTQAPVAAQSSPDGYDEFLAFRHCCHAR